MDAPVRGVKLPDADAFIALAKEVTGLSEFGEPDTWREGLEELIKALNEEMELDAEWAAGFHHVILRRLRNRLRIEETIRQNPEILDQKIEVGACILGLPRTGTTALTNMLALDPQFRSLRMWEQEEPWPAPDSATELTDPRRLAAIEATNKLRREQPEQMAMHLYDADGAEEDPEIAGLDFKMQHAVVPILKFHKWWRDTDFRPTYQYHRRAIKFLQWKRGPNRWLFKSPNYNFHLEHFESAYGDARFIQTHRDPVKSVPSAVSLMASLCPPGGKVDLQQFGRHHSEHLRIGSERQIESRARLGEHRFLDVFHKDLQGDAWRGTLRRIYDFLGYEFRPEVEEKVARWQAHNRAGAHGSHDYTPEQFGLSEAQIRRDFARYIERFNVPAG